MSILCNCAHQHIQNSTEPFIDRETIISQEGTTQVFNPCALSCRSTQMDACYRRHEREKCRAYEQRVREVERGSFTPLVFSTSGGMGRAATVTYKWLASLLSTKHEQPHSVVMGWLRCRLSFSAVMCLRGSRSARNHVPCNSMDIAVHKGRIPFVG